MDARKLQEIVSKLNVELRDINDLLPYAMNSRVHADWKVIKLAKSIQRFGVITPVGIDEDGTIRSGHARVLAAMKLSLQKVPCFVLGHLSKAERRAWVIADNQHSLNSTWDNDMLLQEIDSLGEDDFDLDVIGFSEFSLPKMDDVDLGDKKKEKTPTFIKCPHCDGFVEK